MRLKADEDTAYLSDLNGKNNAKLGNKQNQVARDDVVKLYLRFPSLLLYFVCIFYLFIMLPWLGTEEVSVRWPGAEEVPVRAGTE